MKCNPNDHNLCVMHLGSCKDCGGTNLVSAYRPDESPQPSNPEQVGKEAIGVELAARKYEESTTEDRNKPRWENREIDFIAGAKWAATPVKREGEWVKGTELPEVLPDVVVTMMENGRMFAYNTKHSLKGLQEVLKHHPDIMCCLIAKPTNEEKQSYVETFKQLREAGMGEAWDKIICVCRGLMKDNPCECNCKEFHDELLPNERSTPTPLKEENKLNLIMKEIQLEIDRDGNRRNRWYSEGLEKTIRIIKAIATKHSNEAIEFANFIANENYSTTTLPHEKDQLWEKQEYNSDFSKIEHPELTTSELYKLFQAG